MEDVVPSVGVRVAIGAPASHALQQRDALKSSDICTKRQYFPVFDSLFTNTRHFFNGMYTFLV
ncbi:hypothetical protein EI42_02959 [Thermosporothrix hazakensis]|uniref:Uncharacterized protein n=1 Tax=Thermosporothrix hazakensis TaxID=644383 RepID=A0A326UJI9_THEHA|nr:hypothetical protein EI42_02959 [Thermosporothrix hazakensis]